MKKIFICSPLQAPTKEGIEENQAKARKCAILIYKLGYLPIFTHIYFGLFAPELKDENIKDRRKIITMGLELLKHCDECWIFGDIISDGMRKEIDFCKKHKIKILKGG